MSLTNFEKSNMQDSLNINHTLDTTGLICPEPVMLLHKVIRKAVGGDVIQVLATDPATTRDIPNFCHHLGHTLLNQAETESVEDIAIEGDPSVQYIYLIKKKES